MAILRVRRFTDMHAHAHISDAFSTVPTHDYLGILEGSPASSKKVADFLDLSKEDLSKATGLAKSSIRYDDRMPEELKNRLLEIGNTCELVADYFKGDLKKTALWFRMKNPGLGNISPRDMIRIGRYEKVIQFVLNAINGNRP